MAGSGHSGFDGVARAIRRYLAVLNYPPESDHSSIIRLIEALDGLVAAYHATPDIEPSEKDFEYPSRDLLGGWTRPAAIYQKLPLYRVADAGEGSGESILVLDPSNDLSEIADDMKTVIWLADNVSEQDAIWEFRFGFFIHWGQHLFSVRNHLQRHQSWGELSHAKT